MQTLATLLRVEGVTQETKRVRLESRARDSAGLIGLGKPHIQKGKEEMTVTEGRRVRAPSEDRTAASRIKGVCETLKRAVFPVC